MSKRCARVRGENTGLIRFNDIGRGEGRTRGTRVYSMRAAQRLAACEVVRRLNKQCYHDEDGKFGDF